MSTARMIRDWTYVVVLALLLLSYALSLGSQAISARAADADTAGSVCMYKAPPATAS
jgi:hypothetical protein